MLTKQFCIKSAKKLKRPEVFTGSDYEWLKGQCHEIFCFWFPFMNQFPLSPWVYYSGRFEFFRKFSEIFADQGWPPVSTTPAANFATSFTSVVDTGGKFATGVNDAGGQFATCVKDTGGKLATGVKDIGGKQWEQYQAADTSKWTWRQKFIYMLSLLSKGVPTKLEIFFICHRCQRHRWSTLSCEYLREFSKKFETVLIGHSGVGGKLIHKKNQRQKISWHCSINCRWNIKEAIKAAKLKVALMEQIKDDIWTLLPSAYLEMYELLKLSKVSRQTWCKGIFRNIYIWCVQVLQWIFYEAFF